eukprot:COSAG05_NODE_170_length_15101_cov_28.257684_2_plen_60_part_00
MNAPIEDQNTMTYNIRDIFVHCGYLSDYKDASVNHCGLLSYEPDGKMTMSVLNNMRYIM